MTTYTTILGVETDPGKPVKSDLAKRWTDNPIAMFEGDASAIAAGVQVRRPALLDAIINRVKLDTTSASQAYSVGASNTTVFTLNPYSFLPGVTGANANLQFANAAAVDTPKVQINNPTGGTITGTLWWRYINA